MRIGEALGWLGQGERLAWRSLRAGTLRSAGLRPAASAVLRPLTSPSRYPEYDLFLDRLLDLDDPEQWVLDVGSPKLFSLLLASRLRATLVATDIWPPAIAEAEALRGGLTPEASARLILGAADIREELPPHLLPPGGKFAAAFSMSVIEHIEPDPGGDRIALLRMAELVRPAGRVVVSVPVAPQARSEFLQSEIYGRKPDDDARGAFFQRVYDRAALESLCADVAPHLTLESCTIVEWPDNHPFMRLLDRFPTAMGFAGTSFALLANRYAIGADSPSVSPIRTQGDAILRFTRADS
jgi:SAM-dependent methyltransferase